MVNNNEMHTLQFVRYFTSVPGCHLVLFLDNPEHEVYFDGKDIPNLTRVLCTEDYWHGQLGKQPRDMPKKQHTNIRRGAEIGRELGCRWCLSVDSDELVSNLGELIPQLDTLGEGFDMLRLFPAELVHTEETAFSPEPFKGRLFKYLCSDQKIKWMWLKLRFALAFALVSRLQDTQQYTRHLFFGHCNGKTIFNLSSPITQYKQHRQFSSERDLKTLKLPLRYLILHYDAMDFDTWLFKWSRRISGTTKATAISQVRRLQTRTISEALQQDDPEAARDLFRRWLVYSEREIRVMKRINFVFEIPELD